MDRLADAFRAELMAFTEVVAGERSSPCTVDDALAVTWMAEAATLSLQQHRPVQIDEVRIMTTTHCSADRIAGAPISWGVCEVPNWGYQLTPAQVLAEMQDVGLSATEFGPDGFLPADPQEMASVLESHHLTAVGGFVPVVMYRPDHDPVPDIERLILQNYGATDAEMLVLSADSGPGRVRQPAGAGRGRLGSCCWATWTGSPRWPPSTASARCCTRTSAPWSRPATRCSGCLTARRSRCAWTPGTC